IGEFSGPSSARGGLRFFSPGSARDVNNSQNPGEMFPFQHREIGVYFSPNERTCSDLRDREKTLVKLVHIWANG
ncbi:MAG: hypothetical protein ACREXR_13640, partial [Gammaproteobacteria bacterium]